MEITLNTINKEINEIDKLLDHPDKVYERMFDGFTKEEQKKIQDFMDEFFPINDDDWTK